MTFALLARMFGQESERAPLPPIPLHHRTVPPDPLKGWPPRPACPMYVPGTDRLCDYCLEPLRAHC